MLAPSLPGGLLILAGVALIQKGLTSEKHAGSVGADDQAKPVPTGAARETQEPVAPDPGRTADPDHLGEVAKAAPVADSHDPTTTKESDP